jgi:hypothetical protein
MRTALLLVVGLVACKGKPSGEVPPPPPLVKKDAGVVAPVDLAQAKVTLGCLFAKARNPREVLTVLAEAAPLPVVRMAALAYIDRARLDGESPATVAIADAVTVFTEIDDFDGLRAAFAMVDAMPGPKDNIFNGDAPARARVGARHDAGDIDRDKAAVVREMVLAGNVAEATKLFAALAPKDIDDNYEQEPYLGALVALGKVAEAKALIAKQKAEDRFKMTGVWLDVVLRQGTPIKDGLAVALAELAAAPERGLLWFPEMKLLDRAARVGRAAELVPLYQALMSRHAGGLTDTGLDELKFQLALATGDTATAAQIARDVHNVGYYVVRMGPLDAALAAAVANTNAANEDLVRVWARSLEPGADPAFGARIAAAACPKPAPPRPPATAAIKGLTLTVTEKAKKKQFECDNHDVVVRLANGKTVIGEEVLGGECHGPCTAAEQREGRAALARIEKEIEAGTASESQTDYNFTECMFSGPNVGRIDKVGDRQVALIANHYIGAHDVDKDAYQLALEVCGALHLTETFGGMYAGSWGLDQLNIRELDDQIIVDGKSEKWRGVVFRLTLPACPGAPEEQAIQTE